MRLVLQFDVDADIIDVPQSVINKKDILSEKFLDWLYNKHNNHKYWIITNGGKKSGVCYRSDAFIEWLNKKICMESGQKATLLSEYVDSYPDNLPTLYF